MVKCHEEARQKEEEEKKEDDEMRREKDVMSAVSTANLVDSSTSGVLAGEVDEMRDVERSSSGVLAEEPWAVRRRKTSLRKEIRWIGSWMTR